MYQKLKSKLTTPVSILIGLSFIAFAIYLGLTIEFRSAERACKQEFANYKGGKNYAILLNECIQDEME